MTFALVSPPLKRRDHSISEDIRLFDLTLSIARGVTHECGFTNRSEDRNRRSAHSFKSPLADFAISMKKGAGIERPQGRIHRRGDGAVIAKHGTAGVYVTYVTGTTAISQSRGFALSEAFRPPSCVGGG
jgi:hypothetical protein